jgi:hypothetical protein
VVTTLEERGQLDAGKIEVLRSQKLRFQVGLSPNSESSKNSHTAGIETR